MYILAETYQLMYTLATRPANVYISWICTLATTYTSLHCPVSRQSFAQKHPGLFLCDCVFSSFTHFLQLSMDSKETVRTSNVMLSPFRSFPQFLHNPGQFTGKPIWASTLEATSQLRSSWEGFQKKTEPFVFFVQISWADFRGKQQQTTF